MNDIAAVQIYNYIQLYDYAISEGWAYVCLIAASCKRTA